jgi:hypothetical protein
MSQDARSAIGMPRTARRSPGWRRAGLTTAAAGIALAAAACGGGGSTGGSASSNSVADTQQHALAYSQCMQSHGDPGFPDPQQGPGGAWLYAETPQTRQYFTGPLFNEAQRACKKLQPNQGITAAERQAAIHQLLALARCMRAHGITNFPDPTTSGGGVGISLGATGIDPSSPQFQAAAKACHMPGS